MRLAGMVMLFAVLVLSACSSNRTVSTSGTSPVESAADSAQAVETGTGQSVTKEVPHSKESMSDIKERDAREPHPPRGDVAIPSHRIQRGDNAVAPTPPAGAPAGMDKPGESTPAATGGY